VNKNPKESESASQTRKEICELRWESLTPYETLAVCSGRAEQSDGNHPCKNHNGNCEENAHRGTQAPRDGTSGREDGLEPSFVPTTIQPSEILHEHLRLAKIQTSVRNDAQFFFFAKAPARTLRRPESYTSWTRLAWMRIAGRRVSSSARTRSDSASSSSICGTLVRSVS
jgi:hypothetical protein